MAGEGLQETKQVLFLWQRTDKPCPPRLIPANTQLLSVCWCSRHQPLIVSETLLFIDLVHIFRVNLGESSSVRCLLLMLVLITVFECVCRRVHTTLPPAGALGVCERQ